MADSASSFFFNLRARGDWVRARTLVVLRWIAISGQTAAVLLASRVIGFDLDLTLCAILISASVTVNVAALLIYSPERRLSEQGTLASLLFDLVQLVGLLMVTGGLNNPFAILILAPVTISATALRLRSTLTLGLVAMASIPLMANAYQPLIQPTGVALELPLFYKAGLMAGLAIAIVFLSLYARRVTIEGFAMGEALTATQVALAREQRLAAIGSIAAAAAHELGTPLATIKLVAAELQRDANPDSELGQDLALLRQETDRCRKILADLAAGGREDRHIQTAPVTAIIDEAAQPHADRGKAIVVRWDGQEVEAIGGEEGLGVATLRRSPELIHGLRNLIQNAVDFARSTVWIDARRRADGGLRLTIGDDGPGFPPDMLPRLGEPYVSSRPRRGRRSRVGYEGMGLGVFIARTLLARVGAQITFANASDRPGRTRDAKQPTGALIELIWSADAVAGADAAGRSALGPNAAFADP